MEKLKTYKYREDVVLPGYIDEQEVVHLVGSAYSLVYPCLFEGFGVQVLEAMQCDVPVITSANSAMQEIAKDAALFADPGNHEDISEQMMRLYKDEDLRKELITRGRSIAKEYSWNRTAE